MIITPDEVKFKKIKKDNDYEVHSMMLMDAAEHNDTDFVDIDVVAGHCVMVKVMDLVENYMPNKSRNTSIEMNIILNEDTPIFLRPRRLPIAERRTVVEQIDELLNGGIIEH